jgi:hypothetical protein
LQANPPQVDPNSFYYKELLLAYLRQVTTKTIESLGTREVLHMLDGLVMGQFKRRFGEYKVLSVAGGCWFLAVLGRGRGCPCPCCFT